MESAVVVGGGPAGLATAIMLARRGFGNIQVLDRLPPPASPDDAAVWSDTAKHYLIGISGRGQRALQALGVWDGVLEPYCSEVLGRKDWNPGAGVDEGVERIFTDRPYTTRVIPRARMVSVLYAQIQREYADAIQVRHGVDVAAVSWEGAEAEEEAVLRCEPCATWPRPGGDPEMFPDACDVELGPPFELRTPLLIGADGTRRTIANAMEADDRGRRLPFRRFRVRRFEDLNVRQYKTVPLTFPPDWRRDINYSCRTSTINFDALPTLDGEYCGVLLMKPDDTATQGLGSVEEARAYFDELLPQFSASISDPALQQFIDKEPSNLPVFRYVGPRLHRGASTVLVGDAIHTVKPYFGLGVNSAFEDVQVLAETLDEPHATLQAALAEYSRRRAGEARALVEISRSLDKTGPLAFLTFVLPLILDGIFSKLLPRLFATNTIAMLQRVDLSYQQVRWIKRKDRAAQVALLAGAGAAVGAVAAAAARAVLATAALAGPLRWVLPAVPLAAAGAFAARTRRRVGSDVADVLAAQERKPEKVTASA